MAYQYPQGRNVFVSDAAQTATIGVSHLQAVPQQPLGIEGRMASLQEALNLAHDAMSKLEQHLAQVRRPQPPQDGAQLKADHADPLSPLEACLEQSIDAAYRLHARLDALQQSVVT